MRVLIRYLLLFFYSPSLRPARRLYSSTENENPVIIYPCVIQNPHAVILSVEHKKKKLLKVLMKLWGTGPRNISTSGDFGLLQKQHLRICTNRSCLFVLFFFEFQMISVFQSKYLLSKESLLHVSKTVSLTPYTHGLILGLEMFYF